MRELRIARLEAGDRGLELRESQSLCRRWLYSLVLHESLSDAPYAGALGLVRAGRAFLLQPPASSPQPFF
jgi:hypothetical protein